MRVDNEPRDLVVLIGDQRLFEKAREGQIGEAHLRGDAFDGALGGDASQAIPGAQRGRLRHERFQVVEPVAGSANVYRIHRRRQDGDLL